MQCPISKREMRLIIHHFPCWRIQGHSNQMQLIISQLVTLTSCFPPRFDFLHIVRLSRLHVAASLPNEPSKTSFWKQPMLWKAKSHNVPLSYINGKVSYRDHKQNLLHQTPQKKLHHRYPECEIMKKRKLVEGGVEVRYQSELMHTHSLKLVNQNQFQGQL